MGEYDDDYYSDLTEYPSGDEYNEERTQEYRIKNPLAIPRSGTYMVTSLYEHMNRNMIDLDADYQRDVVWNNIKQQALIDSILRNYYVPPLLFKVQVHGDDTVKVCIDGKQRLTSIRRFMDGDIPYVDPDTRVKYWYKLPKGTKSSSKKLLPEKIRNQFALKQMTYYEYDHLTDQQEREVFQRVQKATALTTAEKHQAYSSPRADFVRRLAVHYLHGGISKSKTIEMDLSRSRGFENALHLVFNLEQQINGQLNPRNYGTEKALATWVESRDNSLSSSNKAKITKVFMILAAMAVSPKLSPYLRFANTRLSPVEFIGAGLLVGKYMGTMTVQEVGECIKSLRSHLRATFGNKDVRNRGDVHKAIQQFLIKPGSSGSGEGVVAEKDEEIISLAAKFVPSPVDDNAVAAAGSRVAEPPSSKRKRVSGDSSDSDQPLQKSSQVARKGKTAALSTPISKKKPDPDHRTPSSSKPLPVPSLPPKPPPQLPQPSSAFRSRLSQIGLGKTRSTVVPKIEPVEASLPPSSQSSPPTFGRAVGLQHHVENQTPVLSAFESAGSSAGKMQIDPPSQSNAPPTRCFTSAPKLVIPVKRSSAPNSALRSPATPIVDPRTRQPHLGSPSTSNVPEVPTPSPATGSGWGTGATSSGWGTGTGGSAWGSESAGKSGWGQGDGAASTAAASSSSSSSSRWPSPPASRQSTALERSRTSSNQGSSRAQGSGRGDGEARGGNPPVGHTDSGWGRRFGK